jgi:serine/threonine-protein kinase
MASLREQCRQNPHIQNGRLDGKYMIVDVVGGGGTACVYKVRTADDPHLYALKLLQDRFFRSPVVLEQFRLEADRLLELRHPNIVRFYDIAIRESYAYLLMDHISGYELSEILRNLRATGRPFPANEVLRTLVQASRALDFLHGRNLIHRDIKAANILLEQGTGKLYLVDFGISTPTKDAATALNAGTRAYMAPEQQANLGIPITTAVDIYAFGVMAFEMLAGQRPYVATPGVKGEEAERSLSEQHLRAPIPLLSQFRPDLPPALDPIFQRVLAKNPADRYPSARSFVADLHQALLPHLSPDLHNLAEVGPLLPKAFIEVGPRSESASPSQTATLPPSRTSPMADSSARPYRPWAAVLAVLILVALIALGVFLNVGGGNQEPEAQASPSSTVGPSATLAEATPEQSQMPSPLPPSPSPTAREVPSNTPEPSPSPSPSFTPSPTRTEVPSNTPSNTPSFTPSPSPIAEQASYYFLSGGAVLGWQAPAAEVLSWLIEEGQGPLFPFNTGPLANFRAEIQLDPAAPPLVYGLAYQIQGEGEDYLLFKVDEVNGTWALEARRGDQVESLQTGSLAEARPALSLQYYQGAALIWLGGERFSDFSQLAPQGGLALWLPDPQPNSAAAIQDLQVALVGDSVVAQAALSTPTPAPTLDLNTYLVADLRALLATGDRTRLTVDCRQFSLRYENLERHAQRPDPALAANAQTAIRQNELIQNLCRTVINGNLDLSRSPQDFLTWATNLEALLAQLSPSDQ